jgi:hypothetical protein
MKAAYARNGKNDKMLSNKRTDELEVRRLTVLVTLAIMLVVLLLLGLSDAGISAADTNFPNNEVTSSTSNSSASATTVTTMTGVIDE